MHRATIDFPPAPLLSVIPGDLHIQTFIKGDIVDFDTCLQACEGVDFVLNEA